MAFSLIGQQAGASMAAWSTWTTRIFGPGWHRTVQPLREPVPGDLLVVAFQRPSPPIIGPPGWTQATGGVFYRILGEPQDLDVTFHAPSAELWEAMAWMVEEVPPSNLRNGYGTTTSPGTPSS